MADGQNREVLITFKGEDSDISRVAKRLATIEKNAITVTCEFDGKTMKGNFDKAIAQIEKKGQPVKMRIDLDMDYFQKQLTNAKTLEEQETIRKNMLKTMREFATLPKMFEMDGFAGAEAALKTIADLQDKIKNGEGTGDGIGIDPEDAKQLIEYLKQLYNEIISIRSSIGTLDDEASFHSLLSSINNIEHALNSLKSVFVDIGDGEEFSPLFKTLNQLITSVSELQTAIAGININMSINTGKNPVQQMSAYGTQATKTITSLKEAYSELISIASKAGITESKLTNLVLKDDPSGELLEQFENMSSKTKKTQMNAYNYIVNAYKNALTSQGIDLSSFNAKFVEDTNKMVESTEAMLNNSGDVLGKFFGNINKIDFSGFIKQLDTIIEKLDVLIQTAQTFEQTLNANLQFDKINTALNDENNTVNQISGKESGQLSTLEKTILDIKQAVELKTDAFREEGSVVEQVVNNELTLLGTLWATIDDITNAVRDLTQLLSSNGSNSGLSQGLADLQSLDFNKLESLKNLRLSEVFDIKTNTKSFKNLVENLRELSSINFSELAKLKGLDFSGLSELKNVGQAGTLLSKESSSFMSVQLKQIDSALTRYRKIGVDEGSLSEIKELRALLTSNFTVSGLLNMDDVNSEMSSFVTLLNEAMNKTDILAANMKKAKESTEQSNKSLKSYDTLLNREQALLSKQIKNGTLTNKETLELQATQAQRRAIEKQYKNEVEYQNLIQKRKAIYADLRNDYNDILSSASQKANDILTSNTADDFIDPAKFVRIQSIAEEITQLQNKFKSNGQLITSDLEKAAALSEELRTTINGLKYKNTKKGTYFATLTDVKNSEDAINKMKALLSDDALSKNMKIDFGSVSKDGTKLSYTLKTIDGSIKEMSASWDSATNHITTYMNKETEYISQGKRLINSIKGKFADLTRYIGVSDVLQKIKEFGQKGFEAVLDINTAMTELKKVTDETSESYSGFLKQASSIALDVGGTPNDVINATADFARVGNDLQTSAKLAKDAVTLKNVSEFENINDATDSLISMTQAYKDIDSGEIVDVMNNIGNNFAISTDELSTALQKSASALTTGGNDLYEAAALITAGNTILQDADSVAAGMKVISMRIAGTSAEALTELGEDTDGLVETTSKLQEKVKMLTSVNGGKGVSLLDDKGNYRSTYEILQDIADVYDDILAADKADGQNRSNALLELLAGKNRSNVLASILQNPDVLRSAYESAQNSSGSAINELNTYLESIQGHLDKLTATFQTLWSNAINTDVLNFFIDMGTNIMKLVNSFGMMRTAVAAITAIISTKGVGRANKLQLSLIN